MQPLAERGGGEERIKMRIIQYCKLIHWCLSSLALETVEG